MHIGRGAGNTPGGVLQTVVCHRERRPANTADDLRLEERTYRNFNTTNTHMRAIIQALKNARKKLVCTLKNHPRKEVVHIYPSRVDNKPGDWVVVEYRCNTCSVSFMEPAKFEDVNLKPASK
jgi:hypothetical protein